MDTKQYGFVMTTAIRLSALSVMLMLVCGLLTIASYFIELGSWWSNYKDLYWKTILACYFLAVCTGAAVGGYERFKAFTNTR